MLLQVRLLTSSVRSVTMIEIDRAERAIREFLIAVGEDPDRDGLQETPARVVRLYSERLDGRTESPEETLAVSFDSAYEEMVLVRDIPAYSLCEHHLLPFFGVAHVGYIPNRKGSVTGLSKLARIVDFYARRLQTQERMTGQIADALMEFLEPQGVIVVIESEHLCMTMRGVKKPGVKTVTSAIRGIVRDSVETRNEALRLVFEGHRLREC